MDTEGLKKYFPYGARVYQLSDREHTFKALLSEYPDTDPEYFTVWMDPYHPLSLSRDVSMTQEDGLETTSSSGEKYFLRPLAENQKPEF